MGEGTSAPQRAMALDHLGEVFQALRRGRHLDIDDGVLYADLKGHAEEYRALFAQLGFDLQYHPRDFFYFIDRENFTELSSRMALFVFLLIENLADRGEPVEETLMTRRFRLADLPHLVGDRAAGLMAEAGVSSAAELEQTVRSLERFGFVRRLDVESFVFRTPAYRFLDVCLEIAAAPPRPDAPPAGAP